MNFHEQMTRHMAEQISAAFGLSTSQIAETRPPLTADILIAQMRELHITQASAPPRIIFTSTALEFTAERLFPESKNRSARIRKKLIKRFGGEYRMRPAIWRVGNDIFAHPSFKEQFRAVGVEAGRAA